MWNLREQGRNLPGPESRRKLCDIFHRGVAELFGELLDEGEENVPPPVEKPGMGEFTSVFHFKAALPGASEFYGRRTWRMMLHSRLAHQASMSLVGPRRIGKTWLLQYLQCVVPVHFGETYRIGYVNAARARYQEMDGLVDSVLKALNITPTKHIAHPVLRLGAAITQAQKRYAYALCIDEFGGMCALPDLESLLDELRSLADDACLCVVTASRRPVADLLGDSPDRTSPFVNIFQQLEPGPFDREEAQDFAEKKGSQAGFLTLDREFLLASAGGRPGGSMVSGVFATGGAADRDRPALLNIHPR